MSEALDKKTIYDGQYMSVSSDGIMSFSDGIGFLDSVDPEETYELYLALRSLYQKKQS